MTTAIIRAAKFRFYHYISLKTYISKNLWFWIYRTWARYLDIKVLFPETKFIIKYYMVLLDAV